MTNPTQLSAGVTQGDIDTAAEFIGFLRANLNNEFDHLDTARIIARHRLSSTSALEAEIAFLKQRLGEAEDALRRIEKLRLDQLIDCRYIARAALQEQEKRNGG